MVLIDNNRSSDHISISSLTSCCSQQQVSLLPKILAEASIRLALARYIFPNWFSSIASQHAFWSSKPPANSRTGPQLRLNSQHRFHDVERIEHHFRQSVANRGGIEWKHGARISKRRLVVSVESEFIRGDASWRGCGLQC